MKTDQTHNTSFSPELQSLRGLACLVVLSGHCWGSYEISTAPSLRLFTSLLNGSGAVAFFFVLSGVVLTLSLGSKPLSLRLYLSFLVRRAFRIYPMLIFAVILGTIYCNVIFNQNLYTFSTNWFNRWYREPIGPLSIIAGFAGGISAKAASPIWSIFVEIVGSLCIPFFVAVLRLKMLRLPAFLILLVISLNGTTLGCRYYWPVFLINFFAGASIAIFGKSVTAAICRLSRISALSIVVACTLGICTIRAFVTPLHSHADPLVNLIETGFAVSIISLILYKPGVFRLLRLRPLVALGDYSYSIYLVHFPIVFLTVQVLAHTLSAQAVAANQAIYAIATIVIVALLSGLLSGITFRLVEVPFNRLGRRLTGTSRSPTTLVAFPDRQLREGDGGVRGNPCGISDPSLRP